MNSTVSGLHVTSASCMLIDGVVGIPRGGSPNEHDLDHGMSFERWCGCICGRTITSQLEINVWYMIVVMHIYLLYG